MEDINRRRFLLQSGAIMGGSLLTAYVPPALGQENGPLFETAPQHAMQPTAGRMLVNSSQVGGWTFQAASEIPAVVGEQLAGPSGLASMSPATVPGTALNSMIVNGKYADPFYGKIVTDAIPDTLKDTDYWYRAVFDVPVLNADLLRFANPPGEHPGNISLDQLEAAVDVLGADLAVLQGANIAVGAELAKLAELASVVSQLKDNVATVTPPGDPGEVGFLTDELYSLRLQFAALAATLVLREKSRRYWLRFDGINYIAHIWLNGISVGTIEGAFKRGIFDVTNTLANAAGTAYLAVRIQKLDFSEGPLLPSYDSGRTRGGRNGGPTGVTLKNGPTFFCASGWDWLPTIPDRELGIWQPVSWFTTGAVRFVDVHVDPTLSGDLRTAEVKLNLALNSNAKKALTAMLVGQIGETTFRHKIQIPVGASSISVTSADIPALRLASPKLWWPNGYGDPHLYDLMLQIEIDSVLSDEKTLKFGVRKFDYSRTIGSAKQLSITVNNVPILIMGGNWGLDEALKRIPRQRLFDQVRLHRDANLNLIRNWNGQSTSEDFFAACDEYGILVWQDFFYSTEGPAAADIERDLANIRDCIINYRNHPSILLWCGGNEGAPPKVLVDGLDRLVTELDPKRISLESSAGDNRPGRIGAFASGGPYHWTTPTSQYSGARGTDRTPFHNEKGSYSIPTLEFIQAMIPPTSWECPDDFWADRDINANGGNGGGSGYIRLIGTRYGDVLNLADFARKAQLMNYEAIKAIYESHAAFMIGPISPTVPFPLTGVIMWMSNPAQPSFVWQMYSHDLEQHSAFYAVQHGCRRINTILDYSTRDVAIANHTAQGLSGNLTVKIINLDGLVASTTVHPVNSAAAASFTRTVNISTQIALATSAVCFVHLSLADAAGAVLSENLYWYQKSGADNDYKALDQIAASAVSVNASIEDKGQQTVELSAVVENTGNSVALMIHLQAYDTATGARLLPAFFSSNYLNLLPGQKVEVTAEIPGVSKELRSRLGIRVDGWKIDQSNSRLSGDGVEVIFNANALATNPAQKTFQLCG